MAELFANDASSTLASGISASALTLTVQAGDGAKFPNPSGSDFFRCVLFKKSTLEWEIVKVTSRSSDVLTITRSEESTSAISLNAGDLVELRPTAAFFSSLNVTDINIQEAVFNTAGAETGSANTYAVTLSPTLSAYNVGLEFTFVPGNTNTGASTINADTVGGKSILRWDGSALQAGDITASRPTKIRYDGTAFRLSNIEKLPNVTTPANPTSANLNRLTSIAGNGALDAFPSGTLMLFQQTAAPTGWTKKTTHNDKALRVVSGTVSSGGTKAFTTTFGAGKSTDSYALLEADIPAHDHGSGGSHTHSINTHTAGSTVQNSIMAENDSFGNSLARTDYTNSGGTHTHASFGGGGGHSHALTNFDLQYVDLIIASKD